eukprot:4470466-Amphidinium_carterae.1
MSVTQKLCKDKEIERSHEPQLATQLWTNVSPTVAATSLHYCLGHHKRLIKIFCWVEGPI